MALKDDYFKPRNGEFSSAANACLDSIVISGGNGRYRYKLRSGLHDFCCDHRIKCLAKKVEGPRNYCLAMQIHDYFLDKK